MSFQIPISPALINLTWITEKWGCHIFTADTQNFDSCRWFSIIFILSILPVLYLIFDLCYDSLRNKVLLLKSVPACRIVLSENFARYLLICFFDGHHVASGNHIFLNTLTVPLFIICPEFSALQNRKNNNFYPVGFVPFRYYGALTTKFNNECVSMRMASLSFNINIERCEVTQAHRV